MKKIIVLSGFLLVVFIFFACAQKITPEGKPSLSLPLEKAQTTGKLEWENKWHQTLLDAKKEARLVLYTTAGPEARQIVGNEIKNKYGISIEFMSGKGTEMVERIIRERKAGIYAADLMISGATTMITMLKPAGVVDFIEPDLILPEVMDPAVWFEGKLPFLDKDKQVLNIINYPGGGSMGFNSDLVNKSEIKSATYLLNPKWKGKIVMSDPTISGPGATMLMVIGEGPLGYDYIRKYAEQKPVIIRDQRLVAEWVGRGKYAFAVGARNEDLVNMKEIGLPLDRIVLPEAKYLSEGGSSLVLFKQPPHPSSRKLFTNWLLSREGSTLWSQVVFKQSSRIDVPTDYLSTDDIREPGVNYFILTEEYKLGEGSRQEKMKEIFKGILP